jgi:ribonucleoside-diphosphate reductase alpha chain
MAVKTPERDLSANALTVLRRRYLIKDEQDHVIESPEEMFRRVASNIAKADEIYGNETPHHTEERFYRVLSSLEFLRTPPRS